MSGKYIVISGQHRLVAARTIIQEDTAAGKSPPSWALTFSCRVVRQDTPLEHKQTIAGLTQAKESTVRDMGLSERVAWLWREMEKDKAQAEDDDKPWQPNRANLIKITYAKTGCKESTDGSQVCTSLCTRFTA